MTAPHTGIFVVNSGSIVPMPADADAFVRAKYADSIAAAYAKGYRTTMLHMPAGWTWTAYLGTFPPSQWYSLAQPIRDAFTAQLGDFYASHADARLIVYTGFGVVDDTSHPTHRGMLTPDTGLDAGNPYHVHRMIDNIRGWLDIAPGRCEIAWDAASKWRGSALVWNRLMALHGIRAWGEALPTGRNPDGSWKIDAVFAGRMPWMAVDTFLHARDPETQWTNPGREQLAVWIGYDQTRPMTIEGAMSLRDRGFTLAAHRPEYVDLVAAISPAGPP